MVTRQWKREVISRCYNLLIKTLFGNRFSDAQCGFKAIKCGAAQALLPQVEDNEWFFDTELLLLAEERCLRISEVPVDWIEDLDSRVDVASTALKDVKGLLRVLVQRLRRRFIERWFPEASNVAHHARSWRLIGERPPRLAKQAGREVEPGVVEVEVGDGRARIRAAG